MVFKFNPSAFDSLDFGLKPIDLSNLGSQSLTLNAPLSQADLASSASRAASSPLLNVSTPTVTAPVDFTAYGPPSPTTPATNIIGNTSGLSVLTPAASAATSRPGVETITINPRVQTPTTPSTEFPVVEDFVGPVLPSDAKPSPAVVSDLTLTPDFVRRATAEDQVKSAFQDVLGRQPLPGPGQGLEYWTDELLSGRVTPENLEGAIARGAQGGDRLAANQFLGTDFFKVSDPATAPYRSLLASAATVSTAPSIVDQYNTKATERIEEEKPVFTSWEELPNVDEAEIQAAQDAGYTSPMAYFLAKVESTDPELAPWREENRDQIFNNRSLRRKFGDLFAKPMDQDAVQHIYGQLKDQYELASEQGYKYKFESDIDEILESEAAKLVAGGVTDLYQIGTRETPQFETFNNVQKIGNNYYTIDYESETGNEIKTKIRPELITDISEGSTKVYSYSESMNVREQLYNITVDKGPVTELINKVTGDPLYDASLKGDWRTNPMGYELRNRDGRIILDVEPREGGYGRIHWNTGVRDQADMMFMQTADGLPIVLPVWKSTKDTSWMMPVAMFASAFIGPYATQLGASLGATTAAGQAMLGTGVINVGTQLVLNDGKVNLDSLVLSVGTAGLAANAGWTGSDIAADAAQLAEQGLSAAQITDTLAATGVNSVTANLAGNFAAAGVPVELAPAITSGTTNMGLTALVSLAGENPLDADALFDSFATGAAGGISEVAIQDIVGADRIAEIAQDLNLTPDQALSVATQAVTTGINAEVLDRGEFFDEFAQTLVVNGASFATANKVADSLRDSIGSKGVAAFATAAKDIVKVAGNAAWDNLDPAMAVETMAPVIIGNSISAYARTPDIPAKKTEGVEVAGEVTGETLKALADKPLIGEEATEPVTDAEGNTRRTVTGTDNDGNDYSYTIVKDADGNVSYSYQTQDGSFVTSTSRPDLKGAEEVSGAEVTPVKPPSEIGEKALEPAFDKDKALEEIGKEATFSGAFDKARDLLGPGETFDWKGKSYSTATSEERPDLVTTKPGDNTQTDTGAAFHSNIGKTYSPEDMRILEMSISDNASKLPPPTSEMDFVTAAATGQEVPVVGDKISKDIAAPFVTALGTLTRGSAGIVDYTRGALESIEVIDSTSPLAKGMRNMADSMNKTADFQIGDWAINEEKQFVDKVRAAEGFTNKAVALAQAIYEHPSAVLTLSGSEIVEEIPSLAAMMVTGGTTAVTRLLSLGAGAFFNAVESGGQAYNETKQIALDAGLSEDQAHTQAQKSSAGSAALGAVLGTFAEAPLVRNVLGGKGVVSTTVKREVATEFPEEFGQTGMGDYFGAGKFDMNNALSSAFISIPIAGTVGGTMATGVSLSQTGDATNAVISANDPENSSAISQEVNNILGSSTNIQDATQSIASTLTDMGMNPAAAVAVGNTVAAEQVVNNINQSLPEDSKFQISNLNTLIGATSEGSPVTLGEYVGSSVSNIGPSMFVQPDIAIGTKTDGTVLTVADISGAITMNSAPNLEITQDTNSETGVTTKTEINSDTNVTTTTTADPNTDTKTETVINPDTNTQLDIQVDNNTNTVVATETNTDTNVKTDITNNVDVLIEELIDSGMPPDQAVVEAVEQTKDKVKQGTPTGAKKETGGGAPMFTSTPMEESEFESSSLYTRGKPKEFESALAGYLSRLKGPEVSETTELAQRKEPTMSADYFIYGKPTEIDEILGTPGNEIPALNMPQFGMRKGGLVPAFADGGPLTMAAGKLRRDYREGDAVEGPGDGQSDDIPAMLADGEFVIPADVVAALGNGSNKAGADKLYEMMHNIRRDYRKAKPKDLPKPAKSPLSYISRRT